MMYGKYILRRIFYGILMYAVMVFTFSALFNAVTENTKRSEILEQVGAEMKRHASQSLTQERLTKLRADLIAEKEHQYHLDQPILARIFWRAIDTLTFNFGNATEMKAADRSTDVVTIVAEALPKTILLFTTEIILVIIIGVSLGLVCARRPNGILDRATSTLTMITNGLPTWWVGMIFIMIFSFSLGLFPIGKMHSDPTPEGFAGFLDLLWHLALPLLTLVILGIWSTAYVTRNIVLSNLQEDFVMAARARGIPESRVLFGHTLRTSMPAIMTISVLGLFSSIAGNILIEPIFNWPGIGNLYWSAVQEKDVPVILGTLAIQTMVNMIGFVLLDIIYGYLDPRVKVGGKA